MCKYMNERRLNYTYIYIYMYNFIFYIHIYVCIYIHNVPLLTSVDIVPLMKTAGVVEFWTLYIFYWIKVFFKLPFAVSFSVSYIYIYNIVVLVKVCRF